MPVQVTGLTSGVQAIAVGLITACALVVGGVQCWGANGNGEIGNNTTTDSAVPTPTSGLSNVTP